MKKIIALLLSVMMLPFGVLAAAASDGIMSSETLHVQQHLNDYSEDAWRSELASAEDGKICLAENGVSAFQIVVPDNSDDSALFAAEELSAYLNRIVGADNQFPVVAERECSSDCRIDIGATARSAAISLSEIKDDGYLIDAQPQQIYILATEPDALANGVYGFLEDYLACMFVREDYDYVPYFPTIYLEPFSEVSNPDFAWRKVYQYEAAQNGWYRKLRNNGTQAGDITSHAGWGNWVHSSFSFVSPLEYGESHPEFFSYNEEGIPQQLCLSNEDIYLIIEANLAQMIAAQPDKLYWDFSIMDNQNYCTCEACQQVLEQTGSMMGTLLPIINRLARRFPDKIISTLAYTYTAQPPKGMVCEPNVNIVLATMKSGQLYSYYYGGSEKAAAVKELVESWGSICDNLMIWDYVVDFAHLSMPYPNFDVQADNHKLYQENHVRAIFHQGSRTRNDEMARVRTYLLSKLMWDTQTDVSATLAKYVLVTYGEAAPYVAEYLDTMNRALKENAKDLDLYDYPNDHFNDYLSVSNIDTYRQLIDSAMAATDDSRILGYLEEIKINVLYAVMGDNSQDYARKEAAFEEFCVLAEKYGLERYDESTSMTEFIQTVYPDYLQQWQSEPSASNPFLSFIESILAFFRRILDWLRNLFSGLL